MRNMKREKRTSNRQLVTVQLPTPVSSTDGAGNMQIEEFISFRYVEFYACYILGASSAAIRGNSQAACNACDREL